MTARLPIPGGDNGNWGDILNAYLEVSLNSDGTIQTAALTQAGGLTTSQIGQPSGIAGLNSSGLVPTSQLGSGTAGSSNFLRGDGTWVVPNSGSSSLAADSDVSINSPSNTQVLTYNGSKWVNQNAPSSPDATTSTPGLVQLSGDLGGTATSPTIAATSNVEGIISANTTVSGALQKTNNLSDVASAASSRTNLGLGSAATISSTAGGDLSGTLPSPNVVNTHLSSALPINQGGTGSTSQNFVDLSTTQSSIGGNKTFTGNTTFSNTITGNISGNAATATTATSASTATSATSTTTATTATAANGLNSASSTVVVSGATAPSSGQVLTATSSTAAGWATPASAPVSSVFTRSGAVVAASGDYTAAQVTNAADKSSGSIQTFTSSVSAPAHVASGLSGATAASRYVGATASGAPSSGTFVVGDFVIDQTAKIWVCTTAGSPGTWTQISSANGGVTSFNSRSGAVVPASGDYTAAQVGALPSTDDLSAIANANATAGSVSMNSNKLTALANGSASTDAVNYGQLESVAQRMIARNKYPIGNPLVILV